ncbi:MAG: DEAD/DEAH box helicase, partial [Thermoguttaceae bacterium]|nr:DEAD/DEAH box helicase [Thermoguttaceae bacterium]
MRWLKQKATKFLEENGRTLELDGSLSQAEELAALLEATIKAATGSASEERSAKARERRPARTLEEIFVDEPTFEAETAADERDAKPTKKPRRAEESERSEKPAKLEKTEKLEKSEKAEKTAKSARLEKSEKPEKSEKREERRSRRDDEVCDEPKPAKRKSAAPAWDDLDDDGDDYDPIAFWERLAADADDEEDETPVARPSAERPKKRRETPDDFEDWSDEVAAKKKSGRTRERTEDEPAFEAASTSRLSDEAEESASSEFDVADFDAESEPRSKKRRSKKRRRDGESAEDGDDGGPAASAKKCPNCEKKAASKGLERFGELTLTKPTLRALAQMGYAEPTPIQAGTIPRIQAGVDLMGQAKTGTGKTAAFMIPIVEFVDECEPVDARIPSPLALVVLPTRELAVQVRDETNRLAQFRDLKVVACYGGKPIASQVEKLRRGCDILVGTPGRIIDLANRGALSLGKARWVVLDEADRMLDVGFRPDVERILRMTPSSRQTLLFSATLAPPVVRLAKAYMRDPESHDFSQKNVSA